MSVRIGINGFGRIGRNVLRAALGNTDIEIAAVLTYERNSWGNDFGDCKPEDVAAARGK